MSDRMTPPQRWLLRRLQNGATVPIDTVHSGTVNGLIRRGLARLETRTITEVKTCVVYKAQP